MGMGLAAISCHQVGSQHMENQVINIIYYNSPSPSPISGSPCPELASCLPAPLQGCLSLPCIIQDSSGHNYKA
jgi:hypothetical protein